MSSQGPKDTTSSIWVAVEAVTLPEKKYFKIGEVAQLVGVEPHVLRYWQTQFPQVRPQKSRSGHRLYRRKDVETLLAVRELLHVQRFTIAGARQALRSLVRTDKKTLKPTSADAGASRAPSRPQRSAPKVDVEQIELLGLEGDELSGAMGQQLAERSGAPMAEVEVEAGDPEGAPAAAPAAAAAATPAATTTAVVAEAAPAPGGDGAALSRGQLGFGFGVQNRAAVEAARAEVRAILDHLDREDAAYRRLRSGS
jgi:DNA-binding transcriptional MerR regulator